jgi:uncharacterized protein GlcG (DUF336 family)
MNVLLHIKTTGRCMRNVSFVFAPACFANRGSYVMAPIASTLDLRVYQYWQADTKLCQSDAYHSGTGVAGSGIFGEELRVDRHVSRVHREPGNPSMRIMRGGFAMTTKRPTEMSRRRLMTVGAGSAALAGVALSSNIVAAQDAATPTTGSGTISTLALTRDGAMNVVQAAMAKATEIGVPTVAVVVDAAGMPKAMARMDGTPLSSLELATDKAFTAASFHGTTEQFGSAVSADPATMASLLKAPGVTLLPGGVPLMVGDVLVGAIGCSGGSGDQDVECANAGAAALGG